MAAGLALPPAAEVSEAAWQMVQEVRCLVTAELSVHGFTVRDLLLLQKGSLVSTKQPTRARIAVRANGSFIASAEFEVFGEHLGIRLTEVG
jgi:flagellar motor switch/type III secretory pathway protein FliN